jgi:type VI protein secretion system component VasK
MSQLPGRLVLVALAASVAILSVTYFLPSPVLQDLGSIWSLFLLAATAATLFWFAYWVCLRRLLRARRISRIRGNRLLHEAATRDLEPSGKN